MNQPRTEQITDKIMQEFAKTLEMFDLSPSEARLFAYLYISEKALTLDEMAVALGKSKTSMSTNIRSLYEINLVTRVWKKGVRKDHYQANPQLFKAFMNTYISKWVDAATHQMQSLKEINHFLDEYKSDGTSAELVNIEDRLEDIIDFHQRIEVLFKELKVEES
ncbi:GbsR/MarR family transcriptional regulator [Virgibacillus kimchii]